LSAAIFVFLSPTFRVVFHAVFAWRSALTLFEEVIRNRSHSIVFQTPTFVFRSLHAEHDKDALRRVRMDFNVRFAGSVWPSELDAGAK
jgi:hypothetical protein